MICNIQSEYVISAKWNAKTYLKVGIPLILFIIFLEGIAVGTVVDSESINRI